MFVNADTFENARYVLFSIFCLISSLYMGMEEKKLPIAEAKLKVCSNVSSMFQNAVFVW